MNRKLLVLSILMAFVLLGLAYEAQGPTTTASTQAAVAPSNELGLVLNIDPTTGAIIEHAAPGAGKLSIPADLASRWSTSDEDLIEGPLPSGLPGKYVHLQGRFENGMVGTIDANGNMNAPCAQGLNTAADLSASQK